MGGARACTDWSILYGTPHITVVRVLQPWRRRWFARRSTVLALMSEVAMRRRHRWWRDVHGFTMLITGVLLTALLARYYEAAVRAHLGWDAAGTVGTAALVAGPWLDVQEFALYAAERAVVPQADSVGRKRTFTGLRQLASALAEIASHRTASDTSLPAAVDGLLENARALDASSVEIPPPLAARRVIDRAVDVAAMLQRERFPAAAKAVAQMREASWMVSPTRALRDQRAALDVFFLRAVGLMRAMGAPLPPLSVTGNLGGTG